MPQKFKSPTAAGFAPQLQPEDIYRALLSATRPQQQPPQTLGQQIMGDQSTPGVADIGATVLKLLGAQTRTPDDYYTADLGPGATPRYMTAVKPEAMQREMTPAIPGRIKVVGNTEDPVNVIIQHLKGGWPENIPDINNEKKSFKVGKLLYGYTDKRDKFVNDLMKYDPTVETPYSMKSFYNAINNWTSSDWIDIRNAMYGKPAPSEAVQDAHRLMMLLAQAPESKGYLYRGSSHQEIPRDTNEFYNPAMSFSARAQEATRKPLIILEPGAKTLPVAALSAFPGEFEHIAGGHFQVTNRGEFPNSGQRFVRIKQVNK